MKHLIKSLASGELMVFLDLVFTFLKWTLPLSKMENTLIREEVLHLSIWSVSVEESTMIDMKICPTIQMKISGTIQSKSLHGFLRM